jgi:probable HAF family extracellular repeat protein
LPENRAVVWYNSRIIDLGTLEGGHESFGYSVNSHGQAVGLAFNTVPDPFSFFGSFYPYQGRAFLWQNGAMWDLGTLGGPDAQASFVNERDQVAGQSYTNSTPNPTTGIPTTDPFFWENGRMLDIGTLGGTYGNPLAFNNLGQVVGTSNMPGDIDFHPFLWSKSQGMHDLGTLGGPTGEVSWINDAGDVVGKADLPVRNHDAVLWKNGVKTDLGTVPGDVCSFAYFVNLRGQVVGTSEDQESCDLPTGQHAFLWEHGGPMVDLNTLIPSGSSLQLVFAFAINESGEIIGAGVPPGCAPQDYSTCGHAYVLIPCAAGDARCQAESPAAPTGLSPAMATQRPATVTPSSAAVSGRGMLDRVRARYGQRHPGF